MNLADTTRIRIEGQCTTLARRMEPEVVVAVGVRHVAEGLFRHDPPTALEIEQAIDRVEDALTASGLHHAARGDLLARQPELHVLLGLHVAGDRVTRDEVEARFQQFASASLGVPGLSQGLPADRAAAAVLLILRESMHHLGYDGVVRVDA